MKEKIKKIITNTEFIRYMFIVLVACILAIPICNQHLNVYADDGIQHIARAFGTISSFEEQGLHPNIISSFSNGFGYSWNLFYGPLSTYGIIIISLICKSFVVAYKIFAFICLILSGIFMYKFMIHLTKNSNTALLASVIYLTFPYHLTDWYIRNALGEFMSFMFVPMVFLGLYHLFNTTENHYYLTIGAVGLILTHNLSTMITALFSMIYVAFHWKALKETRVKKGLILNLIFIITISCFYWAPLLETKWSADYQVYEDGAMATPESVASYALLIPQLFATSPKNTFVFELGIHVIIMLCFSVMTYKVLREDLKREYIFYIVAGLLALIMSTHIFPWKYMPKFLLMIQFPWRMLSIAGFFVSIVCAINMSVVIKKFQWKDVLILSIISVIYVCALNGFIPYDEEIGDITSYQLGYLSGKDAEVIAGMGKAEYLPKKAYDNRFYIATRDQAAYALSGKAIIEEEEKNATHYKAKIQTIEEETVLELPYIYYPGYLVRADGMFIDTFETENGFLGIKLDKNDTLELEVSYEGSQIMKISFIISIISLITFSIYVWKKR